jgi:crossover junction endodeoxyribonuclease RuvC
MIVIGIDPGIAGAFAFLLPPGELLNVEDMPVDKIEKAVGAATRTKRKAAGKKVSGKTTGRVVSARGIWAFLDGFDGTNAVAFMEKLVGMPSKVDSATGARRTMGAASMLSYGRGGGLIEMALHAKGISVTMVPAVTWKKAVSCPTGKDGARMRASQQFPAFAPLFKLVKSDGRAESSLIALYGARVIGGKL